MADRWVAAWNCEEINIQVESDGQRRKVSNVADLPIWLFVSSGLLGAVGGIAAVLRSKLWSWQSVVAHGLNMGCFSAVVSFSLWWWFDASEDGRLSALVLAASLGSGLCGLPAIEFAIQWAKTLITRRIGDDEPNDRTD